MVCDLERIGGAAPHVLGFVKREWLVCACVKRQSNKNKGVETQEQRRHSGSHASTAEAAMSESAAANALTLCAGAAGLKQPSMHVSK